MRLEETKVSPTRKVFNLIKSLFKETSERAGVAPYMRSIGEKAEMIAAQFKQRQIDTEEAMKQLSELVTEINQARVEQAQKGMNTDVFSVYWLARKDGAPRPEDIAIHMSAFFDKYPHWKVSEEQERKVRRELYKAVMPSGIPNSPEFVMKVLRILKGVAS
jgi:type I restriction enzyme R subunit